MYIDIYESMYKGIRKYLVYSALLTLRKLSQNHDYKPKLE